MRRLLGLIILDAKIILTNKIIFLWTIIFPLFSAIVLRRSLTNIIELDNIVIYYFSWFWIFIIFSSFLLGVGLKLTQFRDSGLLKTYILITGSKYSFIFSIIINQIIICSFSLIIFTTTMGIIHDFPLMKLLQIPITLLIFSIPFGLFIVILSCIPIQYKTINALSTVSIYPLFLFAIDLQNRKEYWFDYLNPFSVLFKINEYIYQVSLHGWTNFIDTNLFIVLLCYTLIGMFCITKINLISKTER